MYCTCVHHVLNLLLNFQAGVSDKVANLKDFSDKTLDEHYGGFDGEVVSLNSTKNSQSVSQNIIKRFNQHSIMVMKVTDNEAKKPEANAVNNKQIANGQSTSKDGSGSDKTSKTTKKLF